MDPVSSLAQLRLTQAYGVSPANLPPLAAVRPIQPGAGSANTSAPVAGDAISFRARAGQVVDHVDLSPAATPAAQTRRQEIADRLSAGRVAAAPDPDLARNSPVPARVVTARPAAAAVLPRSPAAVLAMYADPAAKNTAATGVAVGRALDVEG